MQYESNGVEEFHGTSMEESDKAEFFLENLERVFDEMKCPVDQKVTCAVSLLQGAAYDWWKLVLRNPLIHIKLHGTTLSPSLIRSMSLMITRNQNGRNS